MLPLTHGAVERAKERLYIKELGMGVDSSLMSAIRIKLFGTGARGGRTHKGVGGPTSTPSALPGHVRTSSPFLKNYVEGAREPLSHEVPCKDTMG